MKTVYVVKVYEGFDVVKRICDFSKDIAEMVSDTRMAAGSDAYQAALSIYGSAKSAAKQGVPGTQTIVDEMGKLFDGQRNNAKTGEATAK